MRKTLLVILSINILLGPYHSWCGNNLEENRYENVKTINEELLKKYRELSGIHLRLINLSSYATSEWHNDIFLDSAINSISFIMNLWVSEYRFLKWLPAVRTESLDEYVRETIKSIELTIKKTLSGINIVERPHVQLSHKKFRTALDIDIIKELEKAINTTKEGTRLLNKTIELLQ